MAIQIAEGILLAIAAIIGGILCIALVVWFVRSLVVGLEAEKKRISSKFRALRSNPRLFFRQRWEREKLWWKQIGK